MDVIVQRPAALDVHKEQVTACVRVPAPDGTRAQKVREFKTTVGGLLVLHDWLTAHGVTQVAMEATGVYWQCAARRPVVSPAQPGGTRRDVPGPNGLPGSEK
jgi:hypothetical protein